MNSTTIMGEVGDGYSVREHAPTYHCGHCQREFSLNDAEEYAYHVPLCLANHIKELRARNMTAKLDDTYRVPRGRRGYGGGRNGDGWGDLPPEWLR